MNKDVPQRLADLYSDPVFGLVSINPDSPDGVIVYESSSRAGGRAAIEIPNESPHLIDESTMINPTTGREENVPGVSPPGKTFEELVAEYGCTTIHKAGYTYIVAATYDP